MSDQAHQTAPSIPTHTLNDGTTLPGIGFGTLVRGDNKSERGIMVRSLRSAISRGYRLLDTALSYGNEAEVGQAVRASEVDREDLLITTKVPGRFHGYRGAKESLRVSLESLGFDYVDLALIHWPLPRLDLYVDTWRALIEMREEGLIRSIGVSNFTAEHLRRLHEETGVMPAVNQIEMHPYFPQAQLRAVHDQLGIVTQAWSPLGRASTLREESVLTEIADAHGVTPGQVVLRWHLQHGVIPLPASSNPQRQHDNLSLDFDLTGDDMLRIDALEQGRIWGQDPDVHEEY
ncbi:aldo/keto reductase [Citricoccus muralis]|uniref:Aldo/keto reductase n=1 Tax=Citricoccus muralis TaxID=169134 RepID=A0ABY8H6Z2_9MICC|nr:aldo/keto reductase [Citricoccus muralis]WFP16423.1 aldo/keto reductase [Citricoccus muralis]